MMVEHFTREEKRRNEEIKALEMIVDYLTRENFCRSTINSLLLNVPICVPSVGSKDVDERIARHFIEPSPVVLSPTPDSVGSFDKRDTSADAKEREKPGDLDETFHRSMYSADQSVVGVRRRKRIYQVFDDSDSDTLVVDEGF